LIFADAPGKLLLGHTAGAQDVQIALGFLKEMQVFALDVFNHRRIARPAARAHHHGVDGRAAQHGAGAQPALAGNQFISARFGRTLIGCISP
jgi:hypothetical protein